MSALAGRLTLSKTMRDLSGGIGQGLAGDFRDLQSDIRHRLRTPLSAVLGLAETLAASLFGELTPKQLECVTTIDQEGQKLLAALNDSLDLWQHFGGPSDLRPEPINPVQVITSAIAIVGPMLKRRNVEIDLEVDQRPLGVLADRCAILQIAVNALVALTAAAEGTDVIRVRVSVTDSIDIHFSADPSSGAPPERDRRALARAGGWANLENDLRDGCLLAARLARWHGGELSVERNSGASVISVRLPVSVAGAPVGTEPPDAASPVLPARRVLLVEDDPVIAAMIRDFLQARGYEIAMASNGTDALREVHRFHPWAILLDVRLPGADGLEVARALRRLPDFTALPIIAISALAAASDRQRGMEAGVTAYLAKPLQLAELGRLLEAFGVQRQAGRPAPSAAGTGLGASVLPGRIRGLGAFVARASTPRAEIATPLSGRELEVLRLLAAGLRNREIAGELCVTEATVKSHVSSVLRKIAAVNRAEAVAIGLAAGLL